MQLTQSQREDIIGRIKKRQKLKVIKENNIQQFLKENLFERIKIILENEGIDLIENYTNGTQSLWGFDKERANEITFSVEDFPDEELIDDFEEHWVDQNFDIKGWELTIKNGSFIWDKKNTKIIVQKYFPDAHVNVSDKWEINISNLSLARKGYPYNKVGIEKEKALAIAKEYMLSH